MTGAREDLHRIEGLPTPSRLCVSIVVLIVLALAPTAFLAACGSSDPSTPGPSAATVKTAITAGAPKDSSSEPPWNGRFVQVDVTTARPSQMHTGDWHIFVNGREPELDQPASILPYARHAAMVAFQFRSPYTDFGTYRFRVVYAPEGRHKTERAWDFEW